LQSQLLLIYLFFPANYESRFPGNGTPFDVSCNRMM